MIKHLTIRGLDAATETEIRTLARNRSLSVNKAALALIRKGAGIREIGQGPDLVGEALDTFIGTWSKKDERAFLDSIADLERIDEGLWK
jgi:hypothetical protein